MRVLNIKNKRNLSRARGSIDPIPPAPFPPINTPVIFIHLLGTYIMIVYSFKIVHYDKTEKSALPSRSGRKSGAVEFYDNSDRPRRPTTRRGRSQRQARFGIGKKSIDYSKCSKRQVNSKFLSEKQTINRYLPLRFNGNVLTSTNNNGGWCFS